MTLKATEVFTPGAFPKLTYVERRESGLEQTLRDALATPGQLISLSGPSKSGKTVLVERVVHQDHLIPLTGAGIQSPDDIWNRVLDWMAAPNSITTTSQSGSTSAAEVAIKGGAGIPLLVSGEAAAKGSFGTTNSESSGASSTRRGLQQVAKEIANSAYVVLVDDFHYMPRVVQEEAAKIMKEAVRLGVKIVAASVRHRGDDVVRANPELRGRIRSIDLDYWKPDELRHIAENGFNALNAEFPADSVASFVRESAGSPQLMQLICLNACFVAGVREKNLLPNVVPESKDLMRNVFSQTSASTDFRSLVDVLDAGPKTRGTERKMYKFHDGSEADVYRVILKAVAADPPTLSFSYDELTRRLHEVCKGEIPLAACLT